jgi:hypothetical protein
VTGIFLYSFQIDSGAHPAFYTFGTREYFLGEERQGREADQSPPSGAEVNIIVELYLHSPYVVMTTYLIKRRRLCLLMILCV